MSRRDENKGRDGDDGRGRYRQLTASAVRETPPRDRLAVRVGWGGVVRQPLRMVVVRRLPPYRARTASASVVETGAEMANEVAVGIVELVGLARLAVKSVEAAVDMLPGPFDLSSLRIVPVA